jgi:hypothetical protein
MGERQVLPVQMKRTVRMESSYLHPLFDRDRSSERDTVPVHTPRGGSVDFSEFDRAWRTLSDEDVVTLNGDSPADLEVLQIDYDERRAAHRTIFAAREGHEPDVVDAEILEIPRERAGEVLEHILHKLHIAPLLILPIGRWREVFDVVTPVLAQNEQWMAIDSEATIELNTRDPLVCELRDLHLLRAVVETILEHSETLGQGISIAAIRAPLLVEVEPAGGVLLTIGNEGLADEVRAVAQAFKDA